MPLLASTCPKCMRPVVSPIRLRKCSYCGEYHNMLSNEHETARISSAIVNCTRVHYVENAFYLALIERGNRLFHSDAHSWEGFRNTIYDKIEREKNE